MSSGKNPIRRHEKSGAGATANRNGVAHVAQIRKPAARSFLPTLMTGVCRVKIGEGGRTDQDVGHSSNSGMSRGKTRGA